MEYAALICMRKHTSGIEVQQTTAEGIEYGDSQ